MTQKFRVLIFAFVAVVATLVMAVPVLAADPISGAIFTTNSDCSGVDLNIYGDKDEVYLNGGPAHPGAAGLPDGDYYVKVTEPNGTLLGTSVRSANETPVHVTGGEFDQCYKLSDILIKNSDQSQGYDDTTNSGGEYKAWVSTVSTFDNDLSKTDNFKVKPQEGGGPPPQGTLHIRKYYDANANGLYDTGETYLTGWKFRIHDHVDWVRYTPANMVLDASTPLNTYYVSEYMPLQSNWIETDPSTGPIDTASSMEVPPVSATGTRVQQITLNNGDDETLQFGNVCLGSGGGLTMGFWSNTNGKKLYGTDDNALLVGLNLVQNTAKKNSGQLQGTAFDPSGFSNYSGWLLKAESTNMAYMLSAQLSAMELNVLNGKVTPTSMIYAPGAPSANSAGFATVQAVMDAANAELALHPTSVQAGATRTYQENLMKALDRANNNLNFAQPTACAYTFPNN
jgi:hypothetical protein